VANWLIFCVAHSSRINFRYARRSRLENQPNDQRRYASYLRLDALEQKIKIPAKTVVKFRVAKAAKDAILGAKK